MEEWTDWLEWYNQLSEVPTLEEVKRDDKLLRRMLLSFLLSATFKDCSMIIRYQFDSSTSQLDNLSRQKRSSSMSSSLSSGPSTLGQPPSLELKLIDLDPKPLSKLQHYYELDQEIVRNWKGLLDNCPVGEESIRKCC